MSIKRVIILIGIGIAGICLILILFSIFSGVFKHKDVQVTKTERIIMQGPSIPTLSEAINLPDSSIRLKSVRQTASSKDKTQVQYLIQALKDEDPQVREEAALALGEFEDKSAKPFLKESLKDKDVYVQISAVTALAKLGDEVGANIVKVVSEVESKKSTDDEVLQVKIENANLAIKKTKIIKSLQKDLKYYKKMSESKKLNTNDRVYVLMKILKKYENKGIDLSEIRSEMDKLYQDKTPKGKAQK